MIHGLVNFDNSNLKQVFMAKLTRVVHLISVKMSELVWCVIPKDTILQRQLHGDLKAYCQVLLLVYKLYLCCFEYTDVEFTHHAEK